VEEEITSQRREREVGRDEWRNANPKPDGPNSGGPMDSNIFLFVGRPEPTLLICRIILVCYFISTAEVLDMQMMPSDCFHARSTKDIYDDEMT
jgi:hypothetical protein